MRSKRAYPWAELKPGRIAGGSAGEEAIISLVLVVMPVFPEKLKKLNRMPENTTSSHQMQKNPE
jgi:hypothetical protein